MLLFIVSIIKIQLELTSFVFFLLCSYFLFFFYFCLLFVLEYIIKTILMSDK